MERRRKRNPKRLLILLIALFFTTVMFTTTTYAWFTANKTVTVNTLTVNVAAQNGIQISADGTNWKSIVQTDDLRGVHTTTYTNSVNQIPESMEPVSTIGNIDSNGRMEMYYGVVASNASTGQYILTATKEEDVDGNTGKYIAFDLFFKVDAATDIYLTTNSGVRVPDANDTGIRNAARIGFVVLGNTAAGSSIATIQGLNAGTTASKYIWEPNYDIHTPAAVSHARDVYGETTTETGGSPLAYSGVKAPISADDNVLLNVEGATQYSTRNSAFFADVTPAYKTIDGFSEKPQIFSLAAGVTKVRIYMWVEGQDVDCENSASGGNIKFDLQITTEAD